MNQNYRSQFLKMKYLSVLSVIKYALIIFTFTLPCAAQASNFVGDFSNMQVGDVRPIKVEGFNGAWWHNDAYDIASYASEVYTSQTYGKLRFSLSQNGPFTDEINVPNPLDYWGNGTTATFYMKAIAPIPAIHIAACSSSVSCAVTPYFSITPNATPAPTSSTIVAGWNKITVGSVDSFYVNVVNSKPNHTDQFNVCERVRYGAGVEYKSVEFSLSPNGPFTENCIQTPIQLDGTGKGRSATVYVKGVHDSAGYVSPTPAIVAWGVQQGSTPGSNAPVLPAITPHTIKVINIAQVWFETISTCNNFPLENNPRLNDLPQDEDPGLRIYPDKKYLADNVSESFCRRSVRVVAKISEPVSGVTINFKDFDMDDPASDTAPIDPNGSEGNDNRGGASSLTGGETAVTDPQGIARTTLRVTLQPGDNFRVAATANARPGIAVNNVLPAITSWGLDLYGPNDDYYVPIENEPYTRTTPVRMTRLLTVWRKLHIERDSMGRVTGNKITGTVDNIDHKSSGTSPTVFTTDLAVSEQLTPGRFEGGRIIVSSPHGSGTSTHQVITNTNRYITLEGTVPSSMRSGTFVIFDDDDFNDNDDYDLDGDEGEEIPAPTMTGLATSDNPSLNRLAPMFIMPTYDLILGEDDDVAFKLNVPAASGSFSTAEEVRSLFKFDFEEAEDDHDFWTIYVLNAYQDADFIDLDPVHRAWRNSGQGAIARVDDISGQGVIVFQEGINDARNHFLRIGLVPSHWESTVYVHEVAHLFGCIHSDGGIMGRTEAADANVITDVSVNRIRSALHP